MLSKLSVKKPYTVIVGVILVIVLGAVSLTKMTTDLLPDMSLPYALVITTDMGGKPGESGIRCDSTCRGIHGDDFEHQKCEFCLPTIIIRW